jgi:hypothetical protein
MEPTNTELLIVKAGGTYSSHYALKGSLADIQSEFDFVQVQRSMSPDSMVVTINKTINVKRSFVYGK